MMVDGCAEKPPVEVETYAGKSGLAAVAALLRMLGGRVGGREV